MTNLPDDLMPGRDEFLGESLRNHLDSPANQADFVNRVMELVGREPQETSWDVLAAWAPMGMAAAVILALAAGLWLGSMRQTEVQGAIVPADPAELLTQEAPVSSEQVLTAVLAEY